MKKLIALSAASLVALAGVSLADPTASVPGVGDVTVGADGYAVYAEGYEDNGLGPLSGYAYVTDGGQACADDNGHAPDDDPSTPDGTSPTCTP